MAGTSGGRIIRGSTAIITRAAALWQLDSADARRLANRLVDDGLSDCQVASLLAWNVDQVRRAVADRSRA